MKNMIYALCAALVLILLCIPAMAEEAVAPATICDANLRQSPDGMSPILAVVPAGVGLTVMEVVDDWVMVPYGEHVGYLYRDDVQGVAFAEDKPGMSVTIFSSRTAVMTPGEIITLSSRLEGFDGYTVTYQWYCDQGSGLMPVGGATQDTWQFEASIDSLGWSWQLLVRATPVEE